MTERKYPPFQYLVGRVTRNPEDSETKSGKEITKLSVVANRSFERDDSFFVEVAAFGGSNHGEKMRATLNALTKGDRIAMEGTLKEREYNGKTYYDFTPMSVYRAVQVEADDDL